MAVCPQSPRGNRRFYIEPQSEAEAERRIAELTAAVQSIEVHLGDARRAAATPEAEYRDWRFNALIALTAKAEEKRRLVAWLKQARRAQQGVASNRHLQAVLALAADVEWSDEERAIIRQAQDYLEDARQGVKQ